MDTRIYISDISYLNDQIEYTKAAELIPAWRSDKLNKIKAHKSKLHCLGASLLLRKGLEDAGLGINDINNLSILEGENQKPYFVQKPDLYFNLSHSGDMVMLIIGNTENGCDIEEKKKYLPSVAERFYHHDEVTYIKSLQESERINAFYRIWTLKEAFMKITGLGMRLDMHDFIVDISNDIPSITQSLISQPLSVGEIRQFDGYAASYIISDNKKQPIITILDLQGEY